MKKQESTTALATGNLSQNYNTKKESIVDQFVNWFRDFLENAE
ncbi:hypothetical protein [Polaribacter sp.]